MILSASVLHSIDSLHRLKAIKFLSELSDCSIKLSTRQISFKFSQLEKKSLDNY